MDVEPRREGKEGVKRRGDLARVESSFGVSFFLRSSVKHFIEKCRLYVVTLINIGYIVLRGISVRLST